MTTISYDRVGTEFARDKAEHAQQAKEPAQVNRTHL
jgi:hypothetical protein